MSSSSASSPAVVAFDEFDLSSWPLVRVTLQRAPIDDAEITKFQEHFCGLLHLAAHGAQGRAPCPLRLIMCLDGIVNATGTQQLRAATFIQDVKPLVLAGALQATALVVTAPAARSILELILSIAPLASVHKLFDTVQEGHAWLSTLVL